MITSLFTIIGSGGNPQLSIVITYSNGDYIPMISMIDLTPENSIKELNPDDEDLIAIC